MDKTKAAALLVASTFFAGCAISYQSTANVDGVQITTNMDSHARFCRIRKSIAHNTNDEPTGILYTELMAVTKGTKQTVGSISINYPGMVPDGSSQAVYASDYAFRGHPCEDMMFYTRRH